MINIPIVFTIDYKFLPPAYIAIDSLIKNADDTTKYDIHVLYNGVIYKKVNLLKRNIKVPGIIWLSTMFPNCKFLFLKQLSVGRI